MALDLIKTPYELLLEEAGYPRMQAGGRPPPAPRSMTHGGALAMAAQSAGLRGNTNPDLEGYIPPDFIPAYRPDVKGKYGGKEGLETMPTYLDKMQIQEMVKAMRAGEQYGVPQLPPEYLANLALREGRSDFGFNEVNAKNKKALDISKSLATSGQHEDFPSDFAAAIYDKMATAQRLKKPFSTVWNGTGVNRFGQSGNTYTDQFTQGFSATMHPKNADLLNAIREAYNYKAQPKLPPQSKMPAVDAMGNPLGYAEGGQPKTFHDISKLLIQKHLGK